MGMFRDFKDMIDTTRSDELKELKRTAGAMPRTSMLDGVKMANQAVNDAQAWQGQATANPMAGAMNPMGAMAAYNSATPGNATVQSVTEAGMQINGAPVMDLNVLVTVPGQAPYPVTHRQVIALSQIPHFQPGASFPVRVDQADPSKIVIG
jgi:hypothetical protein